MDSRAKVIRAHRALAFFYAFLGIALMALMTLMSHGSPIFGAFIVLLLCGSAFALHFFIALACKQSKPWGRPASMVVAGLMLFGFPVGTLIGIYLLANTWEAWVTSPAE